MLSIERNCVRNCSALEKVVLGNSLKTIEHGAFEGCPNIAEVTSKNPVPPAIEVFDSRPFDSVVYEEAVLRVPIVKRPIFDTCRNCHFHGRFSRKRSCVCWNKYLVPRFQRSLRTRCCFLISDGRRKIHMTNTYLF